MLEEKKRVLETDTRYEEETEERSAIEVSNFMNQQHSRRPPDSGMTFFIRWTCLLFWSSCDAELRSLPTWSNAELEELSNKAVAEGRPKALKMTSKHEGKVFVIGSAVGAA